VDPWLARPADEVLCRYRASWLPELLNATAEGRPGGLMAYFQPIVDLRRGKVFAFEALMRAEIDGRLVAAGEIIDAARAHQATFQFDRLARIAAIRQGAEQIQSGEKLFINFSPSVIYDPAVCLRTTWEVADEVGFDPTSLVFEVVESEAFPDISHLRRILDAYRDKGAQMALDDLGSGHTALHYIDSLRPDLIKLDRNLLPTDPERTNLSLLRGLVDYAHSHGIRVLAEGVETEAQKEIVTGLKMDYAQGWYFGRPAGEMVRRMPVPTANPAVPVGQH